jgi:hypothetical protein
MDMPWSSKYSKDKKEENGFYQRKAPNRGAGSMVTLGLALLTTFVRQQAPLEQLASAPLAYPTAKHTHQIPDLFSYDALCFETYEGPDAHQRGAAP